MLLGDITDGASYIGDAEKRTHGCRIRGAEEC